MYRSFDIFYIFIIRHVPLRQILAKKTRAETTGCANFLEVRCIKNVEDREPIVFQ